ncbi:hypothetical protein DAPPUDRAFT_326847 [Daphnia pulex]|uniref:Uncharacterized protein n=1 Tax=Daphnia pulex TaxID=6669 RepID=E9H8Z1_DAPPU|nr:hypothetical protein DAPPUDRAFT_326847 [Daphnia pulex]|eukprot:EFX71813.1 hypothetical protein DAPPUDRAFT_326847 [Daphnia pulex]
MDQAPAENVLARFSQFLPLTILGILALIGAIVGLLLPETLGAILPKTIEDGENFGKDQSFWDFPCCQRQKEIEPDTVTASSGDSLPVVAAKDSNFIRAPSNRANALRTSIRGEAFRSSLLARQRQQRQLDPNDKSHKTNNPETISSSSAPPPRPPID